MGISAADVKRLREQTGAGMMDCKKALSENENDFEKAVDFLRKKGLAAAAKKQSRVAAEGLVSSFVDSGLGVMVEVNCETDFVAKNDDFKEFTTSISKHISTTKPSTIEELMESKLTSGQTVEEQVNELTLKIGEKIAVRRFTTVATQGAGTVGSYIHGGKIGVLLNISTDKTDESNADFAEYVKDVCMHVAASDVKFISADEIDESFKKREADIYTAQLQDQGKPAEMIPKIVQGKLNKLATEVCLNEQKFVKNPDVSIKQLTKEISEKIGDKITISGFLKYTLGEGIEKRQDNLAEEVAKMTQS